MAKDKQKYTSIDAEEVEAGFVAGRAKEARWSEFLASLDVAQMAVLAADPASIVDEDHALTAAENHAEKKAKADTLVALSSEPDLTAEKEAWRAGRVAQLEAEHVALAWLRDHPEHDDEDVDRAEQARQGGAAPPGLGD